MGPSTTLSSLLPAIPFISDLRPPRLNQIVVAIEHGRRPDEPKSIRALALDLAHALASLLRRAPAA